MAVLLDLYMDDPVAALPYMERYAPAPGEEKLLSGWIADLKQRAGKRAPAGPSPAEPAVADAAPAAPGVVPSGPAEKQEPTP
jgi:hypothetical protein